MQYENLAQDKEVYSSVQKEGERQTDEMELIASENYVSKPVLEAMATVLTNKYSEGYPGKRYYGGNQVVDDVENIALERASPFPAHRPTPRFISLFSSRATR
jgi:glycine hydroxymethyltransferase